METRKQGPLGQLIRWLVDLKNKHLSLQLLWLESLRIRGGWNIWRYDDREAIVNLYQTYCGREPNLQKPVRFSEKLQWLKLHYRPPIQTVLVDKHAVREYLRERGYASLLTNRIATVSDVKDIDFESLPDQFVVKAAHSSGWNLVCRDKSKLNRFLAKRLFAAWLRQGVHWNGREWPYKDVPRRLVVEDYLEDETGGLCDYKFYCFSGEPKFVQANSGRLERDHAQNFYSLDWELLPFGKDLAPRPDISVERPTSLEQMIRIARDLACEYPYIRVDLYDVDGRVVFGELTFYPSSGLPDFRPDAQDFVCGDMLTLPNSEEGSYG